MSTETDGDTGTDGDTDTGGTDTDTDTDTDTGSDGDTNDGEWIPQDPHLNWISIPGGTFEMGCSPNDEYCATDEYPVHSVTVPAFNMAATEVTQAQYHAVMGVNPSAFQPPNYDECLDCPVEMVDFVQAKQFCTLAGGRLPSEAEWEYAARAGTTTMFYCGDDPVCLADIGWFGENSDNKTHTVAEKIANDYGLFDMLGNVEEINEDCWHENYTSAPPDGTAWDDDTCEGYRVVRGGAWKGASFLLNRISVRTGIDLYDASATWGFRCAKD